MAPVPKKLLLVGSAPDALEAKRVVLERAGYVVGVLAKGAGVRRAAEEMGASLVIIDTSAGGPDIRSALSQMCGEVGAPPPAAKHDALPARGGLSPPRGEVGTTTLSPPRGKKTGGSAIPVLVIGPDDALSEFDGPGAALPKPAQKRALIESTRALLASFDGAGPHGGGRRKWSRRSRA